MNLRFIIICCLTLTCACVNNKSVLLPSDAVFPKDWLGTWQGDLKIYNGKGLQQTVPMTLRIQPIDTNVYSYTIQYGLASEGLRPYTLICIDSSRGQFLYDEKNGIKMEAMLMGGRLISQFEVMGSRLMSINWREGELLKYEIVSCGAKPQSLTGDTIIGGVDTIPLVQTYPVRVLQTAVLTRKIEKQ